MCKQNYKLQFSWHTPKMPVLCVVAVKMNMGLTSSPFPKCEWLNTCCYPLLNTGIVIRYIFQSLDWYICDLPVKRIAPLSWKISPRQWNSSCALVQEPQMLDTPCKESLCGRYQGRLSAKFILAAWKWPAFTGIWRYARTNILFPFMYKLNRYKIRRGKYRSVGLN